MAPETETMSDPCDAVPADARIRIIRRNLTAVLGEMAAACKRSRRALREVKLLPITKYVDASCVRLLHRAGLREIGESTVQETLRKRESLAEIEVRWHLVGHLQRNKVGKAVGVFGAIHSLDSLRLADALERKLLEAPAALAEVYVEINVAGESTKSGVRPEDALELLARLRDRSVLGERLAGLMTMAPHVADPEDARPHFRRLAQIRDRAVDDGLLPSGAGLSMGMSNDFAIAIEEGATIVRVGSRLFEGLEE